MIFFSDWKRFCFSLPKCIEFLSDLQICLLYLLQDMQWTKWFIRRVGKVCDGPLGDAFVFLCVVTGASFAKSLQIDVST